MNLNALNSHVYMLQSSASIGLRTVHRYILKDSTDDTVHQAASAILKLIADNAQVPLVPIFTVSDAAQVGELVRASPYLFINGKALCLSSEPSADVETKFRDEFFTQALLKEPVTCGKHNFEAESFRIWSESQGTTCPVQKCKNGNVDPYDIDFELKTELARHMALKAQDTAWRARVNKVLPSISISSTPTPPQIVQITRVTSPNQLTVVQGTLSPHGKFMAIAKIIPIISIVCGIYLSAKAIKKGEILKSLGEFLSGAIANIPFIGTIGSIALDRRLHKHDPTDPKSALETLGLDPQNKPSKEEIEAKIREIRAAQHPDKNGGCSLSPENQQVLSEMLKEVEAAKKLLFSHYKYE